MTDPPSPVTQDDGTDKKVPVVPVQLGYHIDCINRYVPVHPVHRMYRQKLCIILTSSVFSSTCSFNRGENFKIHPVAFSQYILSLNCSSQLFN